METRANPNNRLFLPELDEEEFEDSATSALPLEDDSASRGAIHVPQEVVDEQGEGDENQAEKAEGPSSQTRSVKQKAKKKSSSSEDLSRIQKLLRMLDEREQGFQDFHDYHRYHPRWLNSVVWILGIGLILGCVIFSIMFFTSSKPVEPIYTKIEGIKRLGQMHLVKQQYESVIPITKKKENRKGELKGETLQFLLIAPIEVTGYIDFSQIVLTVHKDSLLKIQLPKSQLSRAYLDFSQTEEFLAEGKFKIFGKYWEMINHKKAYYEIASGINEAKKRVRENAINKHNILKETDEKAKMFLQNFVNTLGYRVEFSQLDMENSPPMNGTDSTGVDLTATTNGQGMLQNLTAKTNQLINPNK